MSVSLRTVCGVDHCQMMRCRVVGTSSRLNPAVSLGLGSCDDSNGLVETSLTVRQL